MYILGYPLLSIVEIANSFLFVYSIIVLAVCVLSFVNPDPSMPLVRILHQLTEPVFARVRRYLPQIGMVDLAPLVVFIAILFVRTGVLPIFEQFANGLIN